MAPTLLYLIRHAHTQADPNLESAQWALSATGKRQAAALAHQPFWSEVKLVALSSERKTWLTVAPLLAQRPLPLQIDARFDELQRPGWTDDYNAQVAQALAQPERAAGSWEPAAAALTRFQAGLCDLCAQYAGQTLALVGHGLTLSLYRAALLGQAQVSVDDWRQLGFAAIAVVDLCAKRLLVDFRPVTSPALRSG